jgi:hypothetical protein
LTPTAWKRTESRTSNAGKPHKEKDQVKITCVPPTTTPPSSTTTSTQPPL